MENFLGKLDLLAGIETENKIPRLLERTIFVCLCLMVLFAPHSIAVTQTAWVTGMLAWVVRMFVKPRPKFLKNAVNIPLLAFFVWSFVTSVFSYAPDISIDKMRNVGVLFIFFLFANNLRNLRAVRFLALALIFSCMVNVLWTPVERIFGRGVEIQGVAEQSPLKKGLLLEGDTLLRANKKEIRTPEELLAEIEKNETTEVFFYRPDFYFSVNVKRSDLLEGSNTLEILGIESWKKSHNWRSQGFYGHYATYAEVLQMIASLAFGLIVALFGRKFFPQRSEEDAEMGRLGDREKNSVEIEKTEDGRQETGDRKQEAGDGRQETGDKIGKMKNQISQSPYPRVSPSPRLRVTASHRSRISPSTLLIILPICLIGMLFALLLTITRAPQLGFMISAFCIVLAFGSRKLLLILAAIALPVAIGGLIFLNQTRGVGFFDRTDGSITYRETVYKEGFDLWTQNPRHFIFGVGMDSIKRYAKDWRLFDDGKLQIGHFHSTPLQLLVERGLPALLIWLWLFAAYISTLWKGIRVQSSEFRVQSLGKPSVEIHNPYLFKGILLGCFGGAIGFFASSMVHFNLGDEEVAMVFYILMGLGIFTAKSIADTKIPKKIDK